MILFESVSGLKVNFHKRLLVGNNVDKNWLFDASLVVNCKIGNIVSHFFYLDLSIDGNLADLLGCHWLIEFGRGCLGVKVDIYRWMVV
jgi:hypothetical protein